MSDTVRLDFIDAENIQELTAAVKALTTAVKALTEALGDLPDDVQQAIDRGIGQLGHDDTVNAIRELPEAVRSLRQEYDGG